MTFENKVLDRTGWKILSALQENARISYAELAKLVNLTAPAVAERVRKMEEAGIIGGYHAKINTEALGAPITVFIELGVRAEREIPLINYLREEQVILECYNLTGDESFIVKAAVSSMNDLDQLLGRLMKYGQTTTHVVLSNTIPQRVIPPIEMDE